MLSKEALENTPEFIPSSLPSDLSSRIVRIHGEPTAWWVSEFLKNILQFNLKKLRSIDMKLNSINITRPFVGVHIKRREQNPHSVQEYLDAADDYYRKLEQNGEIYKRRIYLATDDPMIIQEASKIYPHFEIIANSIGAELVTNPKTRNSKEALDAMTLDMQILSISDFLICSFSSEFCRLSYELMQTLHRDASDRVHSLDYLYYYHYDYNHFEVYRSHEKRYVNEMKAYVGALLKVPVQQSNANSFLGIRKFEGNVDETIPAFKAKKVTPTKDFELLRQKYS
jgi:glycoprotein 6-alpha-L-fucosyltransferase